MDEDEFKTKQDVLDKIASGKVAIAREKGNNKLAAALFRYQSPLSRSTLSHVKGKSIRNFQLCLLGLLHYDIDTIRNTMQDGSIKPGMPLINVYI